ncbi:MAG TPA: hypothetical protein VL172_01600 [Kofleriaceae bacterium]|nr:hypothetical protein [Kofleriaceae bacterium]
MYSLILLAACSRSPGGATDAGPGDGDGDGDGDADGGSEFVDTGDLFPQVASPGFVTVTLHPSAAGTTRVAFGVPFPRDAVTDAGQIALTDDADAALPAAITETARWRTLGDAAAAGSVRSVAVIADVTFATAEPVDVRVHFGVAAGPALADPGQVTDGWVPAADGVDPDEYPAAEAIREPAVYATLPPAWMSACLMRSRTTAAGADAGWAWYDESMQEFGRTLVNDVSDAVLPENRIDYVTVDEPWLYDRALSLFNLYIRTGDVTWLRRAHRAVRFYANHIDAAGYFDLKDYQDLKYSYGLSLLIDIMLTGDTSVAPVIERVADAGTSWATYTEGASFWTERHQAYALLAALAAWETSGDAAAGERAQALVAATIAHSHTPPFGYPDDGCLVHSQEQHGEGDVGPEDAVCSPWMSALLAEAMWRYYLDSRDDAALEFLARFADAFAANALYDGGVEDSELAGYLMPYYLATSIYKFSDDGAWADWEHTCDVAGLIARGAFARHALGGDATSLATTATTMLTACQADLDYWHRPGSDTSAGLAPWRLSPPRKFSWWFGTTADMPWLLAALAN